jgi:hypothetical protein
MNDAHAVASIGVVHTAYASRANTPEQTSLNPDDAGRVVLR